MLETELAVETVKIVLGVIDKVSGGALDEVGAQVVQYLKRKLQGTSRLDKAKEDPDLLRAAILDKALKDQSFKNELEQLVFNFQKLEKNTAKVIQSTQSGVNINSDFMLLQGNYFS